MAADIVIQGAFEEKSRSTSFQQQVSAFKRGLITDALKRTGGNRMKAAKMLGIDRTSLKRILARQSALESH